jgi:hypothetical protein
MLLGEGWMLAKEPILSGGECAKPALVHAGGMMRLLAAIIASGDLRRGTLRFFIFTDLLVAPAPFTAMGWRRLIAEIRIRAERVRINWDFHCRCCVLGKV